MKYQKFIFPVLFFLISGNLISQDLTPTENESVLVVKLVNKTGGVFGGVNVKITNTGNTLVAQGKSNTGGIFQALVPVNAQYNIIVTNYPEVQVVKIPAGGFSKKTMTLIYEADAVAKQKDWALTPAQEKQIDDWANKLPTETVFDATKKDFMAPTDFQLLYTLAISGFNDLPLAGEKITLHGIKRNKNFTSVSGADGIVKMLLPKGDRYTVNFTYDTGFSTFDAVYSIGTATRDFTLEYIGSKEIERLRKEEAARIKSEELRIKKEEEEFKLKCKKAGISLEEGRRREIMGWNSQTQDTIVLTVFNRNKQWKQKLIVCDLTGSMSPYSCQLLLWYQLNYKLEQNLQFVFFNDGDAKSDGEKIIGNTGGIYYSPSKNYDSLVRIMTQVTMAGSGGDCPENNMEALIKGVKMTKQPYKEILMIADNNAPVKDISLLQQFHQPVHIIVCGSSGEIHPDYLQIAWKTGGTVHTMEQDIVNIAKMLDGETITIGHMKYRLSGGKFYKVDEL